MGIFFLKLSAGLLASTIQQIRLEEKVYSHSLSLQAPPLEFRID